MFSLKHITLLPKLSEGFSPTESEESTGGGGGGWDLNPGPVASWTPGLESSPSVGLR